MSTGTKKEKTPPPKKEILTTDDFSNKDAKEWCEEVRLEVFGRGLTGTTDKFDKANQKAHHKLEKLHDLYPNELPPNIAILEKQYKEAAIRLKHLQGEYAKYEQIKDTAKKQVEGASFIGIKSEKRKKSEEKAALSIQNADIGMAKVTRELEEEIRKLADLSTTLAQTVTDEKDKRKNEKLKKEETQKLTTAEGLLKEGKGYIKFFAGCDKETADKIRNDYAAYSTKDWYNQEFVTTKLTAVTQELVDKNSKWSELKGKYREGKQAFDKNFEVIQQALTTGQEVLDSTSLNTLLTKFYKVQDAALAKKWYDPKETTLFNEDFLNEIKDTVLSARTKYNEWMELKNNVYPGVKQRFDQVGDPKYTLVGLQPMADVVAVAEKNRDFETAIKGFAKAKTEAEMVLKVAEDYPKIREQLQTLVANLEKEIGKLAPEAQMFGGRFRQELAAAMATFDDGRYVKNHIGLKALERKANQAINGVTQQVESLKDPNNVAGEIDKLKQTSDLSPCINVLEQRCARANQAILEYMGYGFDLTPTGDLKKKTDWDLVVTSATEFMKELAKKPITGNEFDDLVKRNQEQQVALAELINTIDSATVSGQQTLTNKQTAVVNKIQELEVALKQADHIFTTATWHRNATAEVARLKSAEGANSCEILELTLARATELLRITSGYTAAEGPLSKKYNGLKSRVEKVIKALSDKKLIKALPTAQASLLEDAQEVLANLQKAGPAMAEEQFGAGTKGLGTITTLEADKEALVLRMTALENKRDTLRNKFVELRQKIQGELAEKVTQAMAGNKPVKPESLAIAKTLAGLEPRLTAEKIEELETLEKRLGNLESELLLLIEDAPDELKKLGEAAAESDQEDQDRDDEILRLRGQYERDLKQFEIVKGEIDKLKGVDKTEKKRLTGLKKDASKAAKKNDWAGAARKMALALRMAETLKSDPKASEPTGRGNAELKKLNPRWKNGVDLVRKSVGQLQATIETTCQEDEAVKDKVADVTTPFQNRVVARFEKELQPDIFQQELLVLQTEEAEGEAKQKDRENRKKYREQALAKVRRMRDIISRDPVFTSVMMSPNPFKTRIDAIQVMRALNDLDLNLQRSV